VKPTLGSRFLALGGRRAKLATRGVASLAVAIAAAAGPAAQLFRLEEVTPAQANGPSRGASQYRIVWGGDWQNQEPRTRGQRPETRNQKPKTRNQDPQQPRLLRPLADQWEAAARIHLDRAETGAPVTQLQPLDCEEPAALQTALYALLAFVPPNPPARGPPLFAF
jgi:hypothetical protein